MFDIAFSELVVIGVVALIVIGPEKLPKVARTVGLLVGRLQRYVANVKDDISREMQLEDLKKLQQQIQENGQKIQTELMLSKDAVSQHLDEVRETLLEAQKPSADTAAQNLTSTSQTAAVESHAASGTEAKPILPPDTKEPQK
ncbi:MAG TPA: Sec-independent protein translocase protein TatB [Methyloradius sp.]